MSEPPPKPEGNPAFRAMGLPRLRAKLPSRNWTIFLSVVGAFSSAVYYDRREARRVKEKWCSVVSHLADQPLPPLALPRKVTVYLSAPPGDGLTVAREHFANYVKPVLNAAAVDFEVVEGRTMGELRAKVAEDIRATRKGGDKENPVVAFRERIGVRSDEEGGALIVGRHTWKEWVRGVHEGWLGPLEEPPPPPPPPPSTPSPTEDENEEQTTKKPTFPPPYIQPAAFSSAELPSDLRNLPPVGIIPFPHILGFLNTPIRLYRFLHRRKLADRIGRETAAVALGLSQPFLTASEPTALPVEPEEVETGLVGGETPAEVDVLREEEADWPKRVWRDEKYKGVWTEDIHADRRVMEKARRFVLRGSTEAQLGEGAV